MVRQRGNLARIPLQCTIVHCIVLVALVGARSVFERSFTLDAEAKSMSESRGALIVVLACRTGKKAAAKVAERVGSGKCLQCERVPNKRGLCSSCYSRWFRARLGLSLEGRAKFDAELIRLGHLLPPQGAREYREKSIWQRVLQATKRGA